MEVIVSRAAVTMRELVRGSPTATTLDCFSDRSLFCPLALDEEEELEELVGNGNGLRESVGLRWEFWFSTSA
jgi:hypothetical protein